MKIKYIDYGIAYTISHKGKNLYIELNKNLKKYPKLMKQVLKHELLHWNAKGIWENFKIDFFDLFNSKKGRELWRFGLKHPRALLCNSPIFFEKGKIFFNWFMVGFWGFMLFLALLIGVGISFLI